MGSTPLTYQHGSAPIQVWLVEDHELFRETIAALLDETPGMQCTVQCTGCEEALAAFEGGLLPDVVLMDIGLPGIDGIEGVRQIKALAPAVQVIMLTVHHDDKKIFEAICAGATGYLLKTVPPGEVVRAIGQVSRGGAPIDSRIARRVLDMFSRLALPQADYGLRDREKEILQLLVEGLTQKQIAARLYLSPHTIDGHVRNIYEKLEVHSRSGAVAKALKENLL